MAIVSLLITILIEDRLLDAESVVFPTIVPINELSLQILVSYCNQLHEKQATRVRQYFRSHIAFFLYEFWKFDSIVDAKY